MLFIKPALLGVLLKKFVVVIWSAGPGPAFIQFVSLTYQSADWGKHPGYWPSLLG